MWTSIQKTKNKGTRGAGLFPKWILASCLSACPPHSPLLSLSLCSCPLPRIGEREYGLSLGHGVLGLGLLGPSCCVQSMGVGMDPAWGARPRFLDVARHEKKQARRKYILPRPWRLSQATQRRRLPFPCILVAPQSLITHACIPYGVRTITGNTQHTTTHTHKTWRPAAEEPTASWPPPRWQAS